MALVSFSRTENSILGKLWWSVDRWLLGTFVLLICVGIIMSFAATPMAAARIGISDRFFFVKRHLFYLVPSICIIVSISLLNEKTARRLCLLLFLISLILVVLSLFCGDQVKGAKRWISIFGISIQPSEFLKPTFAVISGWFFYMKSSAMNKNGSIISFTLYCSILFLLVLQPDIGMSIVITATWFCQLFLNGLPIVFVIIGSVIAICGAGAAYMCLPHVASRIDKFLAPVDTDNYQILKSLESFSNGWLFGVGPGEGVIKRHLPDAHTDFVFSVMGEEFGLIFTLFVVSLYMFIFIRVSICAYRKYDLFSFLALSGLIVQLTLQTLINMLSSLHMIPTKGMTLPFISYGGSSMLSTSVAVGLILCFSKNDIVDFLHVAHED